MRKHLPSTPLRIEKLSHSQHGRRAASDHVGERRLSAKRWVRIGKLNPSIGEILAVHNPYY
jgi:hypothetical protein